MNDILFNVILGIITIGLTVGGFYLVQFLRTRYTKEQLQGKLEKAVIAVRAVEQIAGIADLTSDQKYAIASKFFSSLLKGKVTEVQTKTIIEATVGEMNSVIENALADKKVGFNAPQQVQEEEYKEVIEEESPQSVLLCKLLGR